MRTNLDRIYIRAQVDGLWGSYSLQELLDEKHAGQIVTWFLNKLGFKEGQIISEEDVIRMLVILDNSNIPVVKKRIKYD